MPSVPFDAFNRVSRVQRRPDNPLDRCTIVSVYPLEVVDYKPTVFPNTHRIEGAEDNDFAILVVKGAHYDREVGEDQPWIEIPVPSTDVARAFIQDYINGLPEYVPNVAAPGMFYVLGAHDKKSILKTDGFEEKLNAARTRQKEWFLRLIQMSDKDWVRTNGNPRSVGNTARLAAEKLGIKDKAWMQDFQQMQMTSCPACGFNVNPAFPICSNCKTIINPERAKELGLQMVSVVESPKASVAAGK